MEAKNFLIVGGSSGIGLEIVTDINRSGHNRHAAGPNGSAALLFRPLYFLKKFAIVYLPRQAKTCFQS